MRCFYCAEEIQDAAVVCRYCGRDLQFLKPFVERIVALEERQEELEAAIQDLATRPVATVVQHPSSNGGSSPKGSTAKIAIAALASAFGSWLVYVIGRQFGYSPLVLIISLSVPLPFGLWAGIWSRGRHAGWYALLGTLSGLVGYAAVQITWRSVAPNPPAWGAEDLEYLIKYLAGACLLFMTGGMLGDRIEAKRHPTTMAVDPMAAALARRFVAGRSKTVSAGDQDRIKKLTDMLTAMAPLLTLVGGVIAAYQTLKSS